MGGGAWARRHVVQRRHGPGQPDHGGGGRAVYPADARGRCRHPGLYTRTPAVLAATATVLSQLLPGRFVLGLGSSSQTIMERFNGIKLEKAADALEGDGGHGPLDARRRAVGLRPDHVVEPGLSAGAHRRSAAHLPRGLAPEDDRDGGRVRRRGGVQPVAEERAAEDDGACGDRRAAGWQTRRGSRDREPLPGHGHRRCRGGPGALPPALHAVLREPRVQRLPQVGGLQGRGRGRARWLGGAGPRTLHRFDHRRVDRLGGHHRHGGRGLRTAHAATRTPGSTPASSPRSDRFRWRMRCRRSKRSRPTSSHSPERYAGLPARTSRHGAGCGRGRPRTDPSCPHGAIQSPFFAPRTAVLGTRRSV